MKEGDILICKKQFMWFGQIVGEIGSECKIKYISPRGFIYTDLKNYSDYFITEHKIESDEDLYILSDYFYTKDEVRLLKLESL